MKDWVFGFVEFEKTLQLFGELVSCSESKSSVVVCLFDLLCLLGLFVLFSYDCK